VKLRLRSFAGGEITPELAGRLDLAKFQTGLALARNFITLPHGPAARRPGFEFIRAAGDSTRKVRLIPFTFSAEQTAVLEFGHQYLRIHIGGATLLSPTPAAWATATVYAIGALVTQAGTKYYCTTAHTAGTFATDLAAGRWYAMPATVYQIPTPYAEADLFDIHHAQSADVVSLVHPGYAARELRRLGATTWTLTALSFAAATNAPTITVTPTVAQNQNLTAQSYVVTTVAADGVTESLRSAVQSASNNLGLAGNFNTITWSAVGAATRYNVYKLRGGVYGYIGQAVSPTLSIVDDNVLPDTAATPPEEIITLNDGVGEYPAATTYHEQRRWFAGTNNQPQVLWSTRTGTDANLTSSIPSRDADGMELRIASNQYNKIRHLVALADLIAFTAGGEFRIYADNAPAITPTSVTIKPQGYAGSANVQPVVTTGSIIYVQAQGSRMRELSYSWESSSYRTLDLAIMVPHRFNGYTIVDLAYSRAPDSICWAVRNDGVLLGMTYVPDQQVVGWHAHDTDGTFESVCVVPENNEDVLYAVVRRTIGASQLRYIERLHTRTFVAAADAFFVDSGLTYNGAPVTTLSGLGHLEGKVVDILTDGAVHPRRTVTAGAVTLEYAASVVHIGLPMVSDLRTLPLAVEGAPASGQGTVKNVNKVHLRVSQSNVIKAGPSFDRLREYPARAVSDPYGSPPALRDGELSLSIDPSWNQDGAVCVRQDLPLPLTLLSMTLEVATGG
jgi:hypothetical protein